MSSEPTQQNLRPPGWLLLRLKVYGAAMLLAALISVTIREPALWLTAKADALYDQGGHKACH